MKNDNDYLNSYHQYNDILHRFLGMFPQQGSGKHLAILLPVSRIYVLTKSSLSHISPFSFIFNTFLLTVHKHKLCIVKLKQFVDLLKANSKTCHLLPVVKNTCQSIYVSVSPFNSNLSKEIRFSDS